MSFTDFINKQGLTPPATPPATPNVTAEPAPAASASLPSLQDQLANFKTGSWAANAKAPQPAAQVAAPAIDEMPALAEAHTFHDQAPGLSEDAVTEFRSMLLDLKTKFGTEAAELQLTDTLKFLNANPQVADVLQPEDIGVMVQGMQSTYGTVIKKKQATRQKTQTRTAAVEEWTSFLTESLGV